MRTQFFHLQQLNSWVHKHPLMTVGCIVSFLLGIYAGVSLLN